MWKGCPKKAPNSKPEYLWLQIDSKHDYKFLQGKDM